MYTPVVTNVLLGVPTYPTVLEIAPAELTIPAEKKNCDAVRFPLKVAGPLT